MGEPRVGPLDRLQRRHSVLGFPIGVVYKFFDDFGGYLCALLTYYGFLSLFPALLLLSTVVGFVLRDQPDWQQAILDSALSEFPIVGDELASTGTLGGGPLGLLIGGLAALYGGLGVGQALQYASNTAWMIPRNSRPNPFASRARGLLLLVVAGVTIVLTTGLTIYLKQVVAGGYAGWAITIASVVLNTLVFGVVFVIATTRPLDLWDVLPGAVLAALAWQGLQTVGAFYVSTVIEGASNLNSVFAIVLGLLVFLYTMAVVTMLCVEVNVVRKEHLWPRALLTPFTDQVVLTTADQRSYSRHAEAQRLKGFQRIDVFFDESRGHDDPTE
ncbi:YihY/virulence factor BrkB family protein [Janibacter terrae]|uniref:YihY/virulence factor BrkB family protein n=1 Tax=Janibacter terrae TaxID=103817 RepID=UPI000838538C|nr:YihY/virulence factor BrkB family protein [Janibacter terrae]MBA4085674.1 ribonuclease BN [Kytococcus sp.]